jgi:5-methylcytosine-specific restriction protein A
MVMFLASLSNLSILHFLQKSKQKFGILVQCKFAVACPAAARSGVPQRTPSGLCSGVFVAASGFQRLCGLRQVITCGFCEGKNTQTEENKYNVRKVCKVCFDERSHIMPAQFLHPCSYPGCPNVIREGRYCPAHKTIASREYNQTQRSADSNKIYGRRWRTIRDLYIAKHPLCEECFSQGKLTPADEVHHIVPVDQGGTHADENLQALCQSCHTKTRYM